MGMGVRVSPWSGGGPSGGDTSTTTAVDVDRWIWRACGPHAAAAGCGTHAAHVSSRPHRAGSIGRQLACRLQLCQTSSAVAHGVPAVQIAAGGGGATQRSGGHGNDSSKHAYYGKAVLRYFAKKICDRILLI